MELWRRSFTGVFSPMTQSASQDVKNNSMSPERPRARPGLVLGQRDEVAIVRCVQMKPIKNEMSGWRIGGGFM